MPTSRPTGHGSGPSPLSDPDLLVERLRAAGCVFAEQEARLLTSAGVDVAALAARRVAGEPLEHLLGWADFRGRRVVVTPGVFVPRRRTELLAELAIGILRRQMHRFPAPRRADGGGLSPSVVVDLCCGSGAVGAAVAAELPGAEVYAADVDPVAVDCARRNLPADQVFAGDLFDPLPSRLRGRVVVLVVNAPYVPTDRIATMPPEARDHEPGTALDGGPDGVAVHRRVAAGAAEWLVPGGALVVETSRDLAPLTLAACAAAGLDPRLETDDERDATAVVAVAP